MILKKAIESLAIFSGQPSFTQQLFVGRPNVGDRDRFIRYIDDMFDRRWFTNNGPYVQELEQRLADMLGVKHCITFSNATKALEIAARALNITGQAIVPSFTFIATAHALQWQEITPVFCDVAPGSHNIDPASIERHITPRTSAIVATHVWGKPCDIDALTEIAQKHNLRLIFDAAHALCCSYKGQMVGGNGDAEVFSFHATKFFNTFEGGAATTNNDELAQKMRFMRNFGFAGYDDVQYLGINAKMSEVCAAMGLTMLEELDRIVATNHQHYRQYKKHFDAIPGVRLCAYDESEHNNYHYIIIELDPDIAGLQRDVLVDILHAENVVVRRYFYPGCHEMEPYRSYFPNAGLLLEHTNQLTRRVISFPNGTAVTNDDIDTICDLVAFAVEHSAEIHHRLHS